MATITKVTNYTGCDFEKEVMKFSSQIIKISMGNEENVKYALIDRGSSPYLLMVSYTLFTKNPYNSILTVNSDSTTRSLEVITDFENKTGLIYTPAPKHLLEVMANLDRIWSARNNLRTSSMKN